jgi:hypothetical protein
MQNTLKNPTHTHTHKHTHRVSPYTCSQLIVNRVPRPFNKERTADGAVKTKWSEVVTEINHIICMQNLDLIKKMT